MTLTNCEKARGGCAMGEKCCKVTAGTVDKDVEDDRPIASDFVPYDPSQEPIFPPELAVRNKI